MNKKHFCFLYVVLSTGFVTCMQINSDLHCFGNNSLTQSRNCMCRNNCLKVVVTVDTMNQYKCINEFKVINKELDAYFVNGTYTFSCNSELLELRGAKQLTCFNSTLSGSKPVCVQKEVIPLVVIILGSFQCLFTLFMIVVIVMWCQKCCQRPTTHLVASSGFNNAVANTYEMKAPSAPVDENLYDDVDLFRRL